MKKERLYSLDVFRGLVIAGMIVVNNSVFESETFPQLNHSAWNGFTFADLVFPSFVFIMGVSLSLSLARREFEHESRRRMLRHILRRAAILFAIGFLLNYDPNREHWRIVGVLQRLALVYLAGSVIIMYTDARGQAASAVVLLLGYWALMKLIPVPGFGAGYLGAGHPEGNLAGHIDMLILNDWDPEGFLGTLPAIGTMLTGCLAGHLIHSEKKILTKQAGLMAAGAAAIIAGLYFNRWFPINKKLWTTSFVLLSAGIDMLAFAPYLRIANVRPNSFDWTHPFAALGTNPLAAYILSEIVIKPLKLIPAAHEAGVSVTINEYIYIHCLAPWLSPHAASLAYAAIHLVFITSIMYWFYRRKIFLKL